MLRLIKSKFFIVMTVTILMLVVIGVTSSRVSQLNWLNNIISVPLSPVQKFFSYSSQKIEGGFGYFKDVKQVKNENEELKNKISLLEKENRELLRYRVENKELREVLDLKDQFNDYEMVGANVIAKDPGNWFGIFRIDRGGKDGIKSAEGMYYPVINNRGLIGVVLNSDIISSKVVSIIDPGSSVSAIISKTRHQVIVKGDLSLKEKGFCKMDLIPLDADIAVGDTVETSGIGGIFPKGILIGKVKRVMQSGNELGRYAIIEPSVDFKRLEEVFVLKNKTNINEAGSMEK
ncbi:MAG: rod shape-determining protein MreC [Clostridia bacterium]|nr:rod shape-determining protein MreC [Clostridia bacterium]